jgi:hypothetical protein
MIGFCENYIVPFMAMPLRWLASGVHLLALSSNMPDGPPTNRSASQVCIVHRANAFDSVFA